MLAQALARPGRGFDRDWASRLTNTSGPVAVISGPVASAGPILYARISTGPAHARLACFYRAFHCSRRVSRRPLYGRTRESKGPFRTRLVLLGRRLVSAVPVSRHHRGHDAVA